MDTIALAALGIGIGAGIAATRRPTNRRGHSPGFAGSPHPRPHPAMPEHVPLWGKLKCSCHPGIRALLPGGWRLFFPRHRMAEEPAFRLGLCNSRNRRAAAAQQPPRWRAGAAQERRSVPASPSSLKLSGAKAERAAWIDLTQEAGFDRQNMCRRTTHQNREKSHREESPSEHRVPLSDAAMAALGLRARLIAWCFRALGLGSR
jgi:hypothetical protein